MIPVNVQVSTLVVSSSSNASGKISKNDAPNITPAAKLTSTEINCVEPSLLRKRAIAPISEIRLTKIFAIILLKSGDIDY